MTYEQFLHYVSEHIADEIIDGQNCRIFIKKINKNNGFYVESLHIYREGSKVSPSIELNPFYERYLDGEKAEEILREIADLYEKNKDCGFPLPVSIKEFSSISDRIIMRLVNYDRNQTALQECPHIKILDLAVTFRWLAYQDEIGVSTALITNREMEVWGKKVEQLYKIGVENTSNFFPAKVRTMREVLRDYIDIGEDGLEIYILTNQMGIHGAVCMLYESVLERFRRQIGRDFFILPSSIHEVILVPVMDYLKKEDLYQLVSQANGSIVSAQEVLSDCVYLYEEQKHQISIL
ncbi:MAG: DUF5688 family protein [Lachnospiraceae bacterium]